MKCLPVFLLVLLSCGSRQDSKTIALPVEPSKPGTFGFDVDFLKKHNAVIVLGDSHSKARVLLVPDYQGRVMTSTTSGDEGASFGWINYSLIESDSIPRHIYPVGGEDRFWMGPEGGQYSLFFKKASPFTFDQWQTPSVIDTEPFEITAHDSTHVSFTKSAAFTNYAGFDFQVQINREVRLLSKENIETEFRFAVNDLKSVAFESTNSITNSGKKDWNKETGLVSIWILGMLTPSDQTVVVLPYEKSSDLRGVTDNYFGPIPSDRIIKTADHLLLKADGKHRGKVGVAPAIAKNIAGSYDAEGHVLTLIKFDLDHKGDYVNSKWELQKEPYSGDAVNAYNDGPLENGSQMGPFYELESSSPAKALKVSETNSHRQITLHIEGDEASLDTISKKILGISLREISRAFSNTH